MVRSWGRLRRRAIPVLLAVAMAPLALAQGPPATFNEREVKGETSDKSDVWSLDFRFKDPRLIKVNIPARGTHLCWYLWYQVINRTGQPRTFIPDFELVTHDYPAAYHDEVLPSVQDAIKKVEDPTGFQDIKNSVTIASKPIPVSKPADEAYPRAVTGVAIWDAGTGEGKKDLAAATHFSIFVSGLSNGWRLVDPIGAGADARPVIRRKTLQLNFKRTGGRFGSTDTRDVTFLPPAEWTYRVARLTIPGTEPPAKDKAPERK
jgi:hypothetical protein